MPRLGSQTAITQSKIIFVGNPFGDLTVGSIAPTHTILAMVGRHEGGLQIMMPALTQMVVLFGEAIHQLIDSSQNQSSSCIFLNGYFYSLTRDFFSLITNPTPSPFFLVV